MSLSVTVYMGSSDGIDPIYLEIAQELGKAFNAKGIRLVYGGGKIGLMGTLWAYKGQLARNTEKVIGLDRWDSSQVPLGQPNSRCYSYSIFGNVWSWIWRDNPS
jgi:hypothetical protein